MYLVRSTFVLVKGEAPLVSLLYFLERQSLAALDIHHVLVSFL